MSTTLKLNEIKQMLTERIVDEFRDNVAGYEDLDAAKTDFYEMVKFMNDMIRNLRRITVMKNSDKSDEQNEIRKYVFRRLINLRLQCREAMRIEEQMELFNIR